MKFNLGLIQTLFILASSPLFSWGGQYDGQYLLDQIFDETGSSVHIPSPPTKHDKYTLSITSKKKSAKKYNISIHISNTIFGPMKVMTGRNVTVGPLFSTRMMPPQKYFSLEQTLISILPESEYIHLDEASGILSFNGSMGYVMFHQQNKKK
jgi:hypothetical protein